MDAQSGHLQNEMAERLRKQSYKAQTIWRQESCKCMQGVLGKMVQSDCINCQSQIKHLGKGPQWRERVSPTRSRRHVLVHEVRRSLVITADNMWVGQEGGTEPDCGCPITLR